MAVCTMFVSRSECEGLRRSSVGVFSKEVFLLC